MLKVRKMWGLMLPQGPVYQRSAAQNKTFRTSLLHFTFQNRSLSNFVFIRKNKILFGLSKLKDTDQDEAKGAMIFEAQKECKIPNFFSESSKSGFSNTHL